jgi:hypothetical protein
MKIILHFKVLFFVIDLHYTLTSLSQSLLYPKFVADYPGLPIMKVIQLLSHSSTVAFQMCLEQLQLEAGEHEGWFVGSGCEI